MRRYPLALAVAAMLIACVDAPTEPDTAYLVPEATSNPAGPRLNHRGPPLDRLAYRVTGDFVSSQHSWSFLFAKMTITGLDAWVDVDGNVGGSYDVTVEFVDPSEPTIVSEEEVVCLSVDPTTRKVWLGSARPDEEWGVHYSIVQMQDLSPASMSEAGLLNSGRRDLYTGRTSPPWEPGSGPDFCLQQPDLSEIPLEIPDVATFPPIFMLPIDAGGDIDLQMGGRMR